MSYTVTHYPAGTFSWADFFSTDIHKSKTFLEQLFGWTSQDMPTGEGRPDYTMFYLDGSTVCGGSPTFTPDMPSVWSNYVSVENLDASMALAEKLGAKIDMPAMDVLDAGRMGVIQDPTDAHLSLWQPKNHIGAHTVNTVGAMCWNELYTPDLKKAQAFYGALFGWTFESDSENGYVTIKNNGRSNGGMMDSSQPEMGPIPPHWMVYFTVKNIDDSLKKVNELGGSVAMPPKDIGVGKISVIADPAGAHFMIMEMAVEPEHWPA